MNEDGEIVQMDRRATIVNPPNNLPYLVAIVFMMMLGAVGIVLISVFRKGEDNTALIASLVGFLAPTTLSLLAFMKSQETHLSVNSRLDAFITNARLAAKAEGLIEGRRQGIEQATAVVRQQERVAPSESPVRVEVVKQPDATPIRVEVVKQPDPPRADAAGPIDVHIVKQP